MKKEEIRIHDEKNIMDFKNLIRVAIQTRVSVSYTEDEVVKLFQNWKDKEKLFIRQMSLFSKIRSRFIRFKNPYSFTKFKWFTNNKSKQPNELFLEDVFTEPYKNTYDMDDWALATKMADIFIWKGISLEESSNYFIDIKQYFVNHSMVKGLILFNIYKLKS